MELEDDEYAEHLRGLRVHMKRVDAAIPEERDKMLLEQWIEERARRYER